jgi:hypothetical protein
MSQTILDETAPPSLAAPRLHPWRELSLLAQMGMELCWIVPWYRSLTQATHAASTGRVFLTLGGIMLVSHWLSRGMNFFQIRMDVRRAALAVCLLVSIAAGLEILLYYQDPFSLRALLERPVATFADLLIVIPDEFIVILAAAFTALRGVTTASEHVGPVGMVERFQIGVGMFFLFILLNTLVTGETPGSLIYLFLFLGLTAVGAARVASLERMRGGRRSPLDRRWSAGMIGATGLATLLAGWVGNLIEGQAFQLILRILETLAGVLLAALVLVFSPILILAVIALTWAIERSGLTATLPKIVNTFQQLVGTVLQFGLALLARLQAYLPDPRLVKPALLWSILIGTLLLGLLWVGLRWALARQREMAEDEVASLLEPGELLRMARLALQNRLRQLRQSLETRLGLLRDEHLRAAVRVRQIYAELLALSAELGTPRLSAQTPQEFQEHLQGLFRECQAEVETITQAYQRVRYGELPESPAEIAGVELAWEQVAEAGRQRLSAQKPQKP